MPRKKQTKDEAIAELLDNAATIQYTHVPHETQRAQIGAGYLVCPTCGEEIPS
jgi:RNA polymerase-binding transcription factor DksA